MDFIKPRVGIVLASHVREPSSFSLKLLRAGVDLLKRESVDVYFNDKPLTCEREIRQELAEFKIETKTAIESLRGDLKALEQKVMGEIKALDERVTGQIKALDERVTGFSKRLENQEFINRGIFLALIVAILGGLAKFLGFLPQI